MDLRTVAFVVTLFGLALSGQAGSKPSTQAKTELALDGISLAVYERTSSSPLTSTIKPGTKDSKVHAIDNQKKLQLKFTVKDVKKNEAIVVQQAFVAFVHKDTEREVIFVAEPETGTKNYLVDLDFKTQEKNFDGLNGTYSLRLILGDASAANALDWNFADVKASFSEVVHPPPKKSQIVNYETLPEIKHKFREPEVRPPTIISDTFTLICLAPLALLLILWLRIGLNFGNIQFSLWALGFHVGLISIFGLYFTFWIRLDMFETLKYLAFIGVPTFVCGNRLLRSLNESRKQTKSE